MKRIVITLVISFFTISSFAQNKSTLNLAEQIFKALKSNNYKALETNMGSKDDFKALFNEAQKNFSKNELAEFKSQISDEKIDKIYSRFISYASKNFDRAYNKVDDWSKASYNKKDIVVEPVLERGKEIRALKTIRFPFKTEKYDYELMVQPIFRSKKKWKILDGKFRIIRDEILTAEQKIHLKEYTPPKKPSHRTGTTTLKGDTTADLSAPIIVPERKTKTIEPQRDDVIFIAVEQDPSFPGGEDALVNYIEKNLKYPKVADDNGIEGIVYIEFVVEKNGHLTRAKIVRDIGGGCGMAALKLVKNMPKWKSGMNNGQKVRTSFTLPVIFNKK